MNKWTYIGCEKCWKPMKVIMIANGLARFIKGTCNYCGFRYILKDTDFDYVQPSSSLFDMIYPSNPFKETEKREKEIEVEAGKEKEKKEEKYEKLEKEGKLKPWEKKTIKKEVLNNG